MARVRAPVVWMAASARQFPIAATGKSVLLCATLVGYFRTQARPMNAKHSGRYVAYYRVSTARQGRSGLGLEAQRQAVGGHLNGGNWRLVAEFTEVESGKRSDRPKLAEALKACRLQGAKPPGRSAETRHGSESNSTLRVTAAKSGCNQRGTRVIGDLPRVVHQTFCGT